MDIKKFFAEIARNRGFINELDARIEILAIKYARALQKSRQKAKRFNDPLQAEWELDDVEGDWQGLKAFNASLTLGNRMDIIGAGLETISEEALTFWDLSGYWKTPDAKRAVMSNLWDITVTTALKGERGAESRFREAVSNVG